MILRISVIVVVVLLGSMGAAESSRACKRVKQYGVSGCELLPDRTCPPRYHKQAVGPPDPRMKAPSRLMCVADKPMKKRTPGVPPKRNR
jgi:hypothetical protein